jgi:uncharacterized delta-60 repeat protein
MKTLVWISCALFLSACGDNVSGSVDTPPTPDASPPFLQPTPFSLAFSAGGPDQLQSAIAGPNGTFYVAGFSAATAAGPFRVVVAQVNATGLVNSFGDSGVVTTDLIVSGASDEIDLATQADGKLIVAATVIAVTDPADRDIAVIRLGASGALDTTFAEGGIRVLDLSTTGDGSTVTDASRAVAVAADGSIFLCGMQKAEGNITGGTTPRIDSDFAVVKLTQAGAMDSTWGAGGKYLQDIYLSNLHSNANARFVKVTADGAVIAGGYSNAIGTVQPVIFKLAANGTPVSTFASSGLYHDTILATQTEMYNIAQHGDKLVTASYGRQSGTTNDWAPLRFDANTGVRDTTWGGANNGAVVFDPSGMALGSNLRSVLALPNGKTLLVGSTGPALMVTQDAVFAVLDANGQLDTSYGTGIIKIPLGSNGNDQFWSAAVSGGSALIVGYKGGLAALASQVATQNDDAYALTLTLQ